MHDRLLPIEHQTTCAVSPVKHLSLRYLTLRNKHSFEKKIQLRTYFIDTLYSNYFGKGYFFTRFSFQKRVSTKENLTLLPDLNFIMFFSIFVQSLLKFELP